MPTLQEFNVISICKIDVFQLTSSEKIYKDAILSFEDGKYKERAGKTCTELAEVCLPHKKGKYHNISNKQFTIFNARAKLENFL